MLRKPFSQYENGKSSSLLKYKEMIDVDALVIAVDSWKYSCALPSKDILVATKKQRSIFVKKGDVVTIAMVPYNMKKLQEKRRNTPRYKILCVRRDVVWEDIVKLYIGDWR